MQITISSTYIPNFEISQTAGQTVYVKWKLTESGVDSEGIARVKGWGPKIAAKVYAWDGVSFKDEDDNAPVGLPNSPTEEDGPAILVIPEHFLDTTTDFVTPSRGAYASSGVAYNIDFIVNNRPVKWDLMYGTEVPDSANPTTYGDLALYNKSAGPVVTHEFTYTRDEIDFKISQAISATTNPNNLNFGFPNAAIPTNVFNKQVNWNLSGAALTDYNYAAVEYPADARDYWYYNAFVPGPGKNGVAIQCTFNDAADGGANFLLQVFAKSSGRNTVAIGGISVVTAAGHGWAYNPISFTDIDTAAVGVAIGIEVNPGCLGSGVNQESYGIVVAAIATADTPYGANRAYMQFQANQVKAPPRKGLVFNPGVNPIIKNEPGDTGALFQFSTCSVATLFDCTFMEIGNYDPGIDPPDTIVAAGGIAIDFAATTFAHPGFGSIFRLPYLEGLIYNGIAGVDSQSLSSFNLIKLGNSIWGDDTLYIGDGRDILGGGIDFCTINLRDLYDAFSMSVDDATFWTPYLACNHFRAEHPDGEIPVITTGAFTGGGTGNPSITGTNVLGADAAHRITFTTTAAPAANAKICSIAFTEPMTMQPIIQVAVEGGTAEAREIHARGVTVNGYELWANTALLATTAYEVMVSATDRQ